jgi:hypothetical protein
MAEILNRLIDEKKIRMIGDLNKDEIKLITKIFLISKMKNLPIWEDGANIFMTLLLSKNRESRKELISAISGLSGKRNFIQRLKTAFKPGVEYE